MIRPAGALTPLPELQISHRSKPGCRIQPVVVPEAPSLNPPPLATVTSWLELFVRVPVVNPGMEKLKPLSSWSTLLGFAKVSFSVICSEPGLDIEKDAEAETRPPEVLAPVAV